MAGANVALSMGLKPVFADIDKFTWCLDIKSVENLINKNTKAIIATHTYGNMCEMNELKKYLKLKKFTLLKMLQKLLDLNMKIILLEQLEI